VQPVTAVLDLTSRTVETQQMRKVTKNKDSSTKDFHCTPSPHSHSWYKKNAESFLF